MVRAGAASGLSTRFEQLNGIAIGVFQLNLLAAWTDLHFIPKMEASFLQCLYLRRKVSHLKDYSIPSTRFLVTTIRHRA
jgi:hypothetical protein